MLVKVLVDDQLALAGRVVYCARSQELSTTFDGILSACLVRDQNCIDACGDDTNCVERCGLVIDEDCLDTMQPEQVGLVLKTMNANSFNFVLPDVPTGVHNVKVLARIGTRTSTTEDETDDMMTSTTQASGLIGKGSVTIESVRMIKGEDVVDLPWI